MVGLGEDVEMTIIVREPGGDDGDVTLRSSIDTAEDLAKLLYRLADHFAVQKTSTESTTPEPSEQAMAAIGNRMTMVDYPEWSAGNPLPRRRPGVSGLLTTSPSLAGRDGREQTARCRARPHHKEQLGGEPKRRSRPR